MIPSLIVAAAKLANIDIIAITDHNSCENAGAVMEAARDSGLRVLPGLEVQTVEGVHLLCLFDELEQATAMQEIVYDALPALPMTEAMVGQQMILDGRDEFVGYCEKLISLPTSLEIQEVWEHAESLGGMVIPAHIDRAGTGMCGVLGMLPESPEFEAVEVSANLATEQARAKYPSIDGKPVFHGSDAHWLSAIGERRTVLHLEHRTIAEIRMACTNEGGRSVCDA